MPRSAALFFSIGEKFGLAGRPRPRAASKAHHPVVGGVLVCFAPRGYGERRVDEAVDGAALVHHELPNVDELAGELSDDMYSQKRLVGHPEHELYEAVRKARDPGFRVRAEGGSTYFVGDPGGTRLLLCEADPSRLGDRENLPRPEPIGLLLVTPTEE